MLQVLVNILAGDMQNTLLAPLVDAHINLKLCLRGSEAHHGTVVLVHFEYLPREQAALTSSGSLQDLEGAVSLVSSTLWEYFLNDLFREFFYLFLHFLQLFFRNIFSFSVLACFI